MHFFEKKTIMPNAHETAEKTKKWLCVMELNFGDTRRDRQVNKIRLTQCADFMGRAFTVQR